MSTRRSGIDHLDRSTSVAPEFGGPLDADADRPALRPLTMADVLELPVLAAGQPKWAAATRGWHAPLSQPESPQHQFSGFLPCRLCACISLTRDRRDADGA
jgi:hypothetical protein